MELFSLTPDAKIRMGAVFDEPGRKYRYRLWRIWNEDLKKVLFCMLNPSTASEFVDDPTITRCIGFAKDLGFGGLEVVNLYAVRATDPKDMLRDSDPIGLDNDLYITRARSECEMVIAAWGNFGGLDRGKKVFDLLQQSGPVHCLRTTASGAPSHPLYLPASLKPFEFKYQRGFI